MNPTLTCWKCGDTLKGVIFPVSRREECPNCSADQHVCKMCKEYDGRGGCNEERAERVSDTEKANFCDYFSPSGQQFEKTGNQKAQDAKAKLAALFGEPASSEEVTKSNDELTPAEIAERKLRELLGD
ncbi:hypothetical protein [Aliiglaciecola litoralis]|uniref:Replication restart DNA helicase PriA n=1 Tax=Aliiglaciecola litoralis TaxID=582857 RepID=A0ABN1LPM7_9ALTE